MIVVLLSSLSVFGQSSNTDTTTAKTSLTLATIYGSNISYYGQIAESPTPYVVGYGRLTLPVGLWLSGQSYKLFDSSQGISGLNVSLGYDFNLSKKLSGNISYGRSFYPEDSELFQSVNVDMASAALAYDWKWLSTGLSVDYGLSQGDVFYTTFNATKIIDLGLSLSSKDYFTLEPLVEVVGGTQVFYNTSEEQPGTPQNPNGGGLLGGVPVIGKNGKPLRNPRSIPGSDKNESKTVATTSFDVLSYNFSLPVVYNRTNYSIEASYQGAVLSKSVSDFQKLQSFFNLGFYYTF